MSDSSSEIDATTIPVHFEVASTATSPSVGPPALDVRALSAWYGDAQAVDAITLPVARRRITAIIGPSGAGKSTFLRCLNRLHETVQGARVAGEVLFDGRDIYAPGTDPVRVRREIGMVFQRPNPFPLMTVYDNVLAGLRLEHGLPGDQAEALAERCLRAVGLFEEVRDDWKRKSGAALSGGQQQRLVIARALAVQPKVLLMDEPASALDPISTAEVESLMVELKANYTIVVVTHNLQEAARISDDTAFLLGVRGHGGRLIEFGATAQVFREPREKQTQEYVAGRFG